MKRVYDKSVTLDLINGEYVKDSFFDMFIDKINSFSDVTLYLMYEYSLGNISDVELKEVISQYRDRYYSNESTLKYKDIDMREVLINKMFGLGLTEVSFNRSEFVFERYYVLDELSKMSEDIDYDVFNIFIDVENYLGWSRNYYDNIQSKSEQTLVEYSGLTEQEVRKEKVLRAYIIENY